MGVSYDVDEIFEMAEQIERDGAAFYREAVERVTDPEARGFLRRMALLEDQHERTFADLRNKLTGGPGEPAFIDRDDMAVSYLRAFVSGAVFDRNKERVAIGEDDGIETILQKAIQAEKDSIAFYTGMREALTDEADRGKIDEIIREEMQHVTLLTGELEKRSARAARSAQEPPPG